MLLPLISVAYAQILTIRTYQGEDCGGDVYQQAHFDLSMQPTSTFAPTYGNSTGASTTLSIHKAGVPCDEIDSIIVSSYVRSDNTSDKNVGQSVSELTYWSDDVSCRKWAIGGSPWLNLVLAGPVTEFDTINEKIKGKMSFKISCTDYSATAAPVIPPSHDCPDHGTELRRMEGAQWATFVLALLAAAMELSARV